VHTTRLSPRRIGRPGLVSVLALSASALVACSGGSEPSSAPNPPSSAEAPSSASSEAPSSAGSSAGGGSAEAPSASVVRATETDFAIDLSETELAAGTTTFEVSNDGGATHDLVVETVEGTDVGATKILSPGTSGTVEVTLEPGTYVVYCSVGNHRGMGMELEITVT
jgi:uncharacterized cupredoxin-like copper-binding protein